MVYTDPEELYAYRSKVKLPSDFAAFWNQTLTEARNAAKPATFTPVETPNKHLDFYELTFGGYAADPIKGWLSGPSGFIESPRPLPTIIEYIGYGGGRGLAGAEIKWPSAGYIHLLMDTRGQGGDWGSGGDTPDPHPTSAATIGHLTRGIEQRETMYYRRLITDAVRAIDTALEIPAVDNQKIILTGISQGGGLSLTAGALHPQVKAILPDVAWLCDYYQGATIAEVPPYRELRRYLAVYPERVPAVLENLAYIDGINFARQAHAPALFSVALMDDCVPPTTTFGAYNEYAGPAEMVLYPFKGHEGGQYPHFCQQIQWLKNRGLGA
ncbi:acetylxylan esterase [Gleimia sp. 6138-11-ORH1]|uniref:acetylxylan esterase n=1 Tax=Gleimia sp. 6138-11-ORH1 TaxID=2973937 RepID=UPI00216A088A|nr:acetylxylan esterase [Gleimia sp. 6138-11-ORH1]MCS4485054.1 acetylxylan esterase [Gleimia sp. 6138-11-ORH1]